MWVQMFNIVGGIASLFVVGVLLHGAILLAGDKEREFWARRKELDTSSPLKKEVLDGDDARGEGKEEGS